MDISMRAGMTNHVGMTKTTTAATSAAPSTSPRLTLVHSARRTGPVDRNDGLTPVRRALRRMQANDAAGRFAHLTRMHD